MRDLLRKSDLLRTTYWKARNSLGLPPKTDLELWYNLQKAAERSPGAATFNFPWGEFKCNDLSRIRAQYDEIFNHKEYKFNTDSAEPVIVDCGGNVGLSAIWFKLHYPKSKLIVYEPDPGLADFIDTNLAAAKLGGYTLHRKAVWVKNGQIGFEYTGNDSGKIKTNSTRTVEAVDLAEHLPERTDLLKMDIEGAEYEVINHLCQTGAIQRVRNLACEFHIFRGQEGEFLAAVQQLIKAGLHFSMHVACASPWLGQAANESPFEVIGRHHVYVQAYGWRDGRD